MDSRDGAVKTEAFRETGALLLLIPAAYLRGFPGSFTLVRHLCHALQG